MKHAEKGLRTCITCGKVVKVLIIFLFANEIYGRKWKKIKTPLNDSEDDANIKDEILDFKDIILKQESVNDELPEEHNDDDNDSDDNGKVKVEYDDDIAEILEKMKEDERLPPEKIRKLREMVIRLPHEVLPQHEVEKACGSHVLTAKEKRVFARIIAPKTIKRGVFTAKETQQIVDNWKAFCEMHDWDERNPRPFLFMRHEGNFYIPKWVERKKFVQGLAHGLPRRTLYSVYHRFRNIYQGRTFRGRYTCEEDEYIVNHIERNPNVDESRRFADLAKALNRTRASVWRRYRLIKKKREDCD